MKKLSNSRNPKVFAGADETSVSRPQFFSWINNTNEGATETQTLINLDFFDYLYKEYGMILEIYAFDAGAIDGPRNYYGNMNTEKFKRQFPNGFTKIYKKAKSIGCQLGIWGGPDGFGETKEEAQERIDLMVKLCKDFEFVLFKFDGVCGQLRPNKQDYFIKMMKEVRKYSPDLILLNHRLPLYRGLPYATTELMEGIETYVDVFQYNQITGTHNRIQNLSRGIPPMMSRLQEDHGVCLSSCLDFWDDDLILQSFNRGLILAPEIYGNPWFLRDDEFPKLARIYNLHNRNREILVAGFELDEKKYGPSAVSRGDPDGITRFLTLRNLTWEPKGYKITLNGEIGLTKKKSKILVRKFHPFEKIYGEFSYNDIVEINVPSFRSCLITACYLTDDSAFGVNNEIGVEGCEYEIIKDVENHPVILNLYGFPGSATGIKLHNPIRKFCKATIDGSIIEYNDLFSGNFPVEFSGTPLQELYHRKINDLEEIEVAKNCEQLYEATIFSSTNNCLESRCITRSGPTNIPQVQAARDAFFNQPLYLARGVEDKFAFDGDDSTRWYTPVVENAALRIDLGDVIDVDAGDSFIIKGSEDEFCDNEKINLEFSSDLGVWHQISSEIKDCLKGKPSSEDEKIYFETPEHPLSLFDPSKDPRFFGESRFPYPVGEQKYVEFFLPETKLRYIRLKKTPLWVLDANLKKNGKIQIDRTNWKGNFLFYHPHRRPIKKAWKSSFVLSEIPPNSYLCIAINGIHGFEGAFASISVNYGEKILGSPKRAPSYPGLSWEHSIAATNKNYTYFFPLTEDLVGAPMDAYVLVNNDSSFEDIKPQLWITAHPKPYVKKVLRLEQ